MSGTDEKRTTTAAAIVTNNYLLRLGLQKIVENEPWIRLVEQAAHASNLDEILTSERPQIVIIDSEIESHVPELIQKIKAAAPRIRTILLTGFDDVECTRSAFASGVDGIVLKVQPSAVLIATIRHLAPRAGEVMRPIEKGAAHVKLDHSPAASKRALAPSKWSDGLTEREGEVVRLISEGLSNKDIADRLCISSITVRHHLTNIFDKLGVTNRQKLLLRAHQHGLTEPPALA
jgi:DNA-binding NarL/FixJ family response regulator